MECPEGKDYNSCGSGQSRQCGDQTEPDFCIEGCYCPDGMVEINGECAPETDCPCVYNGQEYTSGSHVKQDCNTWQDNQN